MASYGGKIELQGASEYKKSISDINSQLKLLSSEMKLVSSEFDKNDKSSKNLTNQMELQKEKITKIKDALDLSTKKYGENSTQAQKWQAKLNEAQAELNGLNRELDEGNKKGSVFGDVLKANLTSSAIISGAKALAGAMKEIASSVLELGKQSLKSYAEYEQLIGGVETLFKESSSVVENYANNAYKTAGLSANEYMETVTSFSASLLQSLDNDTAKSAEYADRAITDMSDNANKMGTDMSMIQNAYQGFAKQNYTMLDNLKLGYGGTKTEMQRLIDDANKVKVANGEMADLTIDSFADVTEAIHIIQTEMGIAGTTTKEAGSTIEGSVNSMKSAWQNLLTGVAGNGENMDTLVNNLVDSVQTAAENILPVIERIIENFGKMIPDIVKKIAEKLPELGEKAVEIVKSISKGIKENLPTIMQSAIELINTLLNGIVEMLPDLLQMGIDLIIELAKGLSESLPTLIPVMVDAILTMVNTLLDNIDEIIETGIELLVALTEGIMNALPTLIARLPEIIIKIVLKLSQLAPQLQSAAIRIIAELGLGLIRAIPDLISKIPQIISSMVNALTQGAGDFADIGKNLLKGLWNGISNTTDWLVNKIKGMGNSITKAIKSVFGIHSPSTVFRDEVGKNLALGLGEGFEDTMSDVTKDMTNSIPTSFDTGINLSATSSYNNGINGYGIDYTRLAYELRDAMNGMNVVMNNEKMGEFVVNTVEREVYL